MASAAPSKSERRPAVVSVGDYYTDGGRLYRIEGVHGDHVHVENCLTGDVVRRRLSWLALMTLVRPDAA